MSDGEINVDSIDGEVLTTANIVGQLYPQGEKGDPGEPGQDGFSPIVTTEKVGKTTTITITDAEGEHTATILDGADGQGSGDMRTEVYDVNQNGIVDDAEKVNGHTVGIDVPANAVFTDTTYTAGTGIDITGNVITNTQTSAEWGNITGTLSDQTDLKNALDDKADASSLSSVATSGSYTDLSDKPSIPTKVSDLTNDSGFIDKDVNNLTNYDTSTTVDTKISNSEEVLIGSDSGIKASHELWVDTNDVTPYINSEISNSYGTAQNLGYSQEYVNDRFDGTKPMGDVVVDSIKTKNLLDTAKFVAGSSSVSILDAKNGTLEIQSTSGYYSQANQTISLKANTTYTISYNGVAEQTGSAVVCAIRNLADTATIARQEGSGDKTLTFTTTENGAIIRFMVTAETNTGKTKYTNIQLEEGSIATTYTPYQELNNQEVYSTGETRIGTWIDGKPLYRKVISSTTPSQVNTGTNIYNANSLNIDRIVNLSFNFKGMYNEYATASNVIIMFTRLSGTDRQIACTCTLADYCNKPFYFILEYTKSTD